MLTAVRNEARIIEQFLGELRGVFAAAGLLERLTLVIVDDASTDDTLAVIQSYATRADGLRVETISLTSNRGNQSAMAFGLRQIAPRLVDAYLITADADGEDDVTRIPELVEALDHEPGKIVFVYRSGRADPWFVRALYSVYRRVYRFLTAQRVIPCNMMAIPGHFVPAIVASPLLSLHFSYPPLRLRLPYQAIAMPRRPRYGGRSTQNVELLIHHAMLGLAIFYEQVVARLLFLALAITVLMGLVGAMILVVRLARPMLLPTGFASMVFAMLIGFGFMSVALLVMFCLTCSIFRLIIEVSRTAEGNAASWPSRES